MQTRQPQPQPQQEQQQPPPPPPPLPPPPPQQQPRQRGIGLDLEAMPEKGPKFGKSRAPYINDRTAMAVGKRVREALQLSVDDPGGPGLYAMWDLRYDINHERLHPVEAGEEQQGAGLAPRVQPRGSAGSSRRRGRGTARV